MGEFELIQKHFLPLARSGYNGALVLGPGDDCAIQRIPAGRDLVFSIDTMVEGIHFPESYPPEYLGWRVLAAAASDLAAMGAEPACFTLALTLPEADDHWLTAFARGLADASHAFRLALAGGDTTRGPLSLSIQVHGTVAEGRGLKRSGAKPGDLICVSGTLGDAGAALDYLEEAQPTDDMAQVLQRYHHPRPRLELGESLFGLATSAIDISDGLLADLRHILESSEAGATIDPALIPLSPALSRLKGARAIDYALNAGDDYELCVTIPEASWQGVSGAIRKQMTVIGTVNQDAGLHIKDGPGLTDRPGAGFDHFRSKA